MKRKSLLKNTVFNVTYTLLNLLFPLITSMYVSRILLTDGVGKVAYAQSIAGYFVTFAALGLPVYGMREVAKVQERESEVNKLFSELFILNSIFTTISVFLYLLMIKVWSGYFVDKKLFLATGLLVFLNYFNIDWFYKGKEEYVYIVCRSITIKVLSILSIFCFVKTKSDYCTYALITSMATGGNYLFNVWHARKSIKFSLQNINIRRHLKPICILAVSVLLESVYGKIDTTMLGILANASSTGLYSYAHKTVTLITGCCAAITAVFMPRLSYSYSNNKEEFNKVLSLGLRAITFIIVPAVIGIFYMAPSFMEILYGPEFIPAASTVRILCLIILINCFGDLICYQVVVGTGNEKMRVPSAILGSLVNITMNSVLIPLYSEQGAAIASVTSEFLVNIFLFFKIRKVVKVPYKIKWLFQALISSGIMLIAIICIGLIIHNTFFKCFVSVIIGALLYFSMNLLIRNDFADIIMKKIFYRGK